ncbi:MAG: hypothetical protein ABWJ98_06125 [Hydrogenothermaceae bacterium]
MRVESKITGRIRLRFDNLYEKERVRSMLSKLDGIINIKESNLSFLITYKSNSEVALILDNLQTKKDNIPLDKGDLFFYTAPFIKSPVTKFIYTIGLLGFKKGVITFGVCTMLLGRYLKSKF